jgi:hypothetical protein
MINHQSLAIDRNTTFSPCRKYRYTLWRTWELTKGYCQFIGLNPSTADETQDDPTIRRCINYAKLCGCGALCMTNIFAWRDTDPEKMKKAIDPIGPENDSCLMDVALKASLVIAAWGTHGVYLYRGIKVKQILQNHCVLWCLGTNADGSPKHPLYLRKDAKVIPFSVKNL